MSGLERCNSMTYDNILYLADRAWTEYELEYDLDFVEDQYNLLIEDVEKCFDFLNGWYLKILRDLTECMLQDLAGYGYTMKDFSVDFDD